MNFGTKAGDTVIKQEPTYHQAPNFTTRPFPDGPYELGTVVQDMKHFWPLNEGGDRVPIPKKYSDVKEGITASVSKSLSAEVGILARILDRSVGGDANLKSKKSDNDVYHIQKLETVYFFPTRKYLSNCVELSNVKDHLEGSNYTQPVYLITGLKIAWETTIEMTRGREFDANAKIDATVPGGPVDVNIAANVAVDNKLAMSTKHTKPADFVLGIQVMKLYHRKFPFSMEPTLKSKLESQGAILVDDNDEEDSEDENKVFIADLDDGDMQNMEREVETGNDGKDIVWIISSDTVEQSA
jgi:hypothetical protein